MPRGGEEDDRDITQRQGDDRRQARNDAAQPEVLELFGVGEGTLQQVAGPVELPARVIPRAHGRHEPLPPARHGRESEAVGAHALGESQGRAKERDEFDADQEGGDGRANRADCALTTSRAIAPTNSPVPANEAIVTP